MAPPRLVPDKTVLRQWLDEGLSHEQMAERVFQETGNRIQRSAISVAVQRAGLSAISKKYDRCVPWRVRVGHGNAHPLKMLRLLNRDLDDLDMSHSDRRMLENWLTRLREEKLIVAYDSNDDDGFHYIDQKFKDHKDKLVPIRKAEIHLRRSDDN